MGKNTVRNEAEKMALEYGMPVIIAFLAICVRMAFSADKFTVIGFLRTALVGVFVGALTSMYVSEIHGLTQGEKGALIGLAVVLAEDLIVAVLSVGKQIRDNPGSIIAMILKRRK